MYCILTIIAFKLILFVVDDKMSFGYSVNTSSDITSHIIVGIILISVYTIISKNNIAPLSGFIFNTQTYKCCTIIYYAKLYCFCFKLIHSYLFTLCCLSKCSYRHIHTIIIPPYILKYYILFHKRLDNLLSSKYSISCIT